MPTLTNPPAVPGLELREPIGEGGMSVVYRAVHVNLQRAVAVKILDPVAADMHPDWLRESRVMASLDHPHVLAIHDAGEVDGHRYLVTEHAAGGSLRARMTPDQPWPLERAAQVLDSAAAALEYIHGRGVLHLDLKPENLLYGADGQIRVADFGLSVPHADAGSALRGRFQGTLDYCAPEYRSGLSLDARYDVFSLATVAYELFTGRLPGRVYVPASERNPRLPAALDAVLARGLARDPTERYGSVAEFRLALANACRPAGRRAPIRLLATLAALAAIVAIPLAAFDWQPSGQRPHEPQATEAERPDRLVILHDRNEDLALFAGEGGAELASGSDVPVERVLIEAPPRHLAEGLPLPVWPTPRPALLIRSPSAWGFVHPFQDQSLAQRVIRRWPDLVRTVVAPERNLVRAGGFDGDCLVRGHGNKQWRAGNFADWDADRQITLDQTHPANPTLLLTNLNPARSRPLLGCYQTIVEGPPPGAVLVLRYRARSLHGKGSLAVYAGLPVVVAAGDRGAAAERVRQVATPLQDAMDPVADRWNYRCPGWVIPAPEWRTYVVVVEVPPYATRAVHRNLVIDLTATHPSAVDQAWVDDVELFVWQPEAPQ